MDGILPQRTQSKNTFFGRRYAQIKKKTEKMNGPKTNGRPRTHTDIEAHSNITIVTKQGIHKTM
jgi:hypothetical protein